MTLISLLFVLMLEHFFKISAVLENEYKSHNWFPKWRLWISSKFQQDWFHDWAGIAIILGGPVLLLYLLDGADSGFFFWIFQLVLTLLVLVYCLGPIDQNEHLREYFEAVEQEDLQSAYRHVEDYFDLKTDQPMPEDLATLGRTVTRLILSQSNFSFFAVLMYFILLGPAGALLYRLTGTFEFTEREDKDSHFMVKLSQMRMILDWLPARLTGFLYTMAGDFTGAMSKLNKYLMDTEQQNKQLLEEVGMGALGIQSNICENILEENKQALDLVYRSVVVLIVFIAVMTVFGWLS
ncbi:MAG: regulatory signaling modulator protein AmpE [Gammaproteobacteria bacterium]|nr:regulatory signaling modulator protein AmpE [Gammaproteobacteria bacterium]